MTDSKQTAKKKILGELESIKTLLEDKLEEQTADPAEAPPLLTTPADSDEDEAPLLTEALNGVIKDIEGLSHTEDPAVPTAEDDIPTLQATVEQAPPQESPSRNTPQPGKGRSLFDEPSGQSDHDEAPGNEEASPRSIEAEAHSDALADSSAASPADNPESAPAAESPSAEEQPSLFDPEHEVSPSETAPEPPPTRLSKTPDRAAYVPPTPSDKTENPFLPKHIRDRLHASRTLREATAEAPLEPTENTSEASSEDKLVDEIVRDYLPRIEAELREKVRAMLREERQAAGKSS